MKHTDDEKGRSRPGSRPRRGKGASAATLRRSRGRTPVAARRAPADPAPGARARGTRAGLPVEEAWTIPASWYYDPAQHRRELERVFARTWQQLGRIDQLRRTGDHALAHLAGEPLLLVRGSGGALRAFHNVCRHRAGVVVPADGCSKAFACTYHGWTYGLDGALLAAPEMEGVKRFDKRDYGLVPVSCEAWGPYVFVNLEWPAPPLAHALGPIPRLASPYRLEEIPFALRETYEIACNWKVYVDNYLEGYHIPRAHPGLNKVLDYRTYEVALEGNVVIQRAPARPETRARQEAPPRPNARVRSGARVRPDPRARPEDAGGSLYLWMFPNFMININPDYTQTNLIVPLGSEKTLCIFDYYFPAFAGKGSGRRRSQSIAWADAIQQEDIGICESVQRNLHSRSYTAGRYSARREAGVHHFHELLRGSLARAAGGRA